MRAKISLPLVRIRNATFVVVAATRALALFCSLAAFFALPAFALPHRNGPPLDPKSAEGNQEKKKHEDKKEENKFHDSSEAGKKAEPPEADKSPIALSGQVAEDSAGPEGVIRFWVTIENHSTSDITAVLLRDPDVRGFRLTKLCWPASPENCCQNIPGGPGLASAACGNATVARFPDTHTTQLVDKLAPEQSVTVWGYLEAINPDHKQSAFLTLSWQSASGPSSKTVVLGDVESLSWLRAWALVFVHGWEWSFPLAVIIGGFFYKQFSGWAKAKAKARENERDHRRRTWNMMLPRAQQIAMRYYTPLVGLAFSLRDDLSDFQKDPSVDILASACYYLLMLHRRLRQTLDDIGSYYFKDRDAETLANPLYFKHRHLIGFQDGAERALFSAAFNKMRLTSTYAEFASEKDRDGSEIKAFWVAYSKDMTASDTKAKERTEKNIFVLDAFGALLDYEANRPSLYWYGKQMPIELKFPGSRLAFLDWQEWVAVPRFGLREPDAAALEQRARRYLAAAEKELDVTRDDRTLLQKFWEGLGEYLADPGE